ncbi:phage minor head protein [Actinacidiphila sp. DG2A-62]|uniref:phage minor head protein n=1 Tax=Actinacidiphila sp. DG2A-62 TaxID=3108821 RepID=UPI002DBFDC3C|nr:phage minor head protein [Actinacidiphila sp. DG2A-62]MEC3995003.1 phage minor head protein [Actinacidiphila sp. DG2A-62]
MPVGGSVTSPAGGPPPGRDTLETDLARLVREVLADVAAEFARQVRAADTLTASGRFSVGAIAAIWNARTARLVRPLLSGMESAARALATGLGVAVPPGWDDLPGRDNNDPDTLPSGVRDLVHTSTDRLADIGTRLQDAARTALEAGLAAGDDRDQLAERVVTALTRDGGPLDPGRADRIARTEASAAWCGAQLAAARDMPEEDRPVVKQWRAHPDDRTRAAHAHVNGQIQLLADPFTVAGVDMDAPGDPTAPPELVVNCRCWPEFGYARKDLEDQGGTALSAAQNEVTLVDELNELRAAGRITAADDSHLQGGMIALMPTAEDAQRLAVDGGETPEDLHLTLMFLGDDGAAYTAEQRASIIANLAHYGRHVLTGPFVAKAFGAAHWNPDSAKPAWVWSVGDLPADERPDDGYPTLQQFHTVAADSVAGSNVDPDMVPTQHSPWASHICAAYSDDPGLLPALADRVGPVTFDRLRVVFGGDATDIHLGPLTAAGGVMPEEEWNPVRTWATPDDTAIAFENQETGDGRIFSPGSLYWEGGPWPLQYADEMLAGHEGAELAGAIRTMGRDGDRITATGDLYLNRWAGADAVMLLEQEAPLGISVDLDDVDVEFVDRRPAEDEEAGYTEVVLAASLAHASLLQLPDGAWMIRADKATDWTASGNTLLRTTGTVEWTTTANGQVSADVVRAALTASGITAAAGDPDDPERGEVVHSESAGDVLMRITRGRVRGATLVAMPAYDRARIVLDAPDQTASCPQPTVLATSDVAAQVITYVASSPTAVTARHVAEALGISIEQARGHLQRATAAGHLVRLSRGLYVGASTIPEGPDTTASGGDSQGEAGDAEMRELEASAWSAMRDTEPMPAAWFREPTPDELPRDRAGCTTRTAGSSGGSPRPASLTPGCPAGT